MAGAGVAGPFGPLLASSFEPLCSVSALFAATGSWLAGGRGPQRRTPSPGLVVWGGRGGRLKMSPVAGSIVPSRGSRGEDVELVGAGGAGVSTARRSGTARPVGCAAGCVFGTTGILGSTPEGGRTSGCDGLACGIGGGGGFDAATCCTFGGAPGGGGVAGLSGGPAAFVSM